MRSDSIVIIPTYNEKENIENIIRAVLGLEQPFNILIIDDGSPDGTAAIVKKLMADEFKDRLFLIERTGKLGLGTAYITGFKWAIEQKYDYIFEMDADFSHNPDDLPRLYRACAEEGYDMSVGSRYITGVNVVNWPIGRVLMSYYASKYVLNIEDTDCQTNEFSLSSQYIELALLDDIYSQIPENFTMTLYAQGLLGGSVDYIDSAKVSISGKIPIFVLNH